MALSLSTVDGHLGCFRVLAIVHNTAVNMDVNISLRPCLNSFGYIPEMELLEHMVILLFNFLEGMPY